MATKASTKSKRTSKAVASDNSTSSTQYNSVENNVDNNKPQVVQEDHLTRLMRHYLFGTQDMDTRRVRKNGWNETINAYMSRVPVNWPYNSVVTNPLIRTAILEKTSRLLNAKLQGRLVPREDGDYVKAKIANALLDFQWDVATEGGSMLEKLAECDQDARVYGAAWVLVYWNVEKESNEIKVLNPRDIFIDGSATHVRNARWIQVREYTTFDKLEDRGYDVAEAREMAAKGEITSELRSTRYEDIVKANRGLVDRVGQIDDLENPEVEICTEYGFDRNGKGYMTIFLPRFGYVISDKPLPYKHGKLPVSMLRYYPLGDDIFGESEVESVIPLQRAVNALLCGFIDQCNIMLRPPLKISATGVRIETITYGPGAKWIMNNPNAVQEFSSSGGFIATFNSVYPMLINAFQEAMGAQSQFNQGAPTNAQDLPTATQVMSDEKEQNARDNYNQMYLGEFLKDIMLMWLSNTKQYLLDDPTKEFYILKILGKDNIQEFQQLKLSDSYIPPEALTQIGQIVAQNPKQVTPEMLQGVMSDISMPRHPVTEGKGKNMQVHKKLEITSPTEADLYVTRDDFEGSFDYIPDVKSMQAGSGTQQASARQTALTYALNPEVQQLLQTQGESINIKDVLVKLLEDTGLKDAESIFNTTQQNGQQPGQIPGQLGQQPNTAGGFPTPQAGGNAQPGAGPVSFGPGIVSPGNAGAQGMGISQTAPSQFGTGGLSQS